MPEPKAIAAATVASATVLTQAAGVVELSVTNLATGGAGLLIAAVAYFAKQSIDDIRGRLKAIEHALGDMRTALAVHEQRLKALEE